MIITDLRTDEKAVREKYLIKLAEDIIKKNRENQINEILNDTL